MIIQDFAPQQQTESSEPSFNKHRLPETITATLLFLTPIIIMFFLAAN